MKTRQLILPAICCLPLLSGCASNQSASAEPWTVKPMSSIKHSSDKPEAMYQLGRYYQGQNRHDLAISAYLRAIAVDGGYVEARNGLGVIYSMQGKHDEAAEAFKAAVQQAPKASHIYSNLGYAYYAQGLYAESIAALEQATALDPANQRALNNLGLAYAKAGNPDGSKLAFAKADSAQSAARAVAAAKAAQQDADARSISNAAVDYGAPAAASSMPVPQPYLQTLTPTHAGGIISQASTGTAVPVAESRVKAVKVAPYVYELREQYVEPAQVAAAASKPVTDGKLDAGTSRIEVSNGNGITGMAKKVGQFLHGGGYPAARLTNQKPFQVMLTQIQYRDGYQAQALRLQSSMPGRPELAQSNDMRTDIGVRLVLGKDMAWHLAYFDSERGKTRLAQNGPGSY